MTIKAPPKIELRWRADQIGQHTIDRVCRYYTNNVQLLDMIKMINGSVSLDKTISLVDIYTILNVAMKEKKVKQRTKFLEMELRISEFVTVYKAWKQGVKPKEILALLPGSKVAVDRVLKSINYRTRGQRLKFKEAAEHAPSMILSQAVPAFINGEAGWWIPASAIPKELLDATGLKEPTLDEDILIEHRKTFVESDDTPELQQDVRETVSTGNTDPDRDRYIERELPEPVGTYQSEEEILADEVYQVAEVPTEQTEPVEPPKPVKDQLNDFL